jgi:hypothetical protein
VSHNIMYVNGCRTGHITIRVWWCMPFGGVCTAIAVDYCKMRRVFREVAGYEA